MSFEVNIGNLPEINVFLDKLTTKAIGNFFIEIVGFFSPSFDISLENFTNKSRGVDMG